MINRNYRFSSTLAVRPNTFSDSLDIPDPSRLINPAVIKAGAATAGATVQLPNPFTVENLGLKVGDIILNVDYAGASPNYGGFTTVATISGVNTFTQTANIGIVATTPFLLFKPGNNGCILGQNGMAMGGSDVITVETFGGEIQTWDLSKSAGIPEVLVKKILTENPYVTVATPTVITAGTNGWLYAQFA